MDAVYLKDVVKSFGSFTAVNGISFTVQEGEIFGFLGPNGAGKTTTIKMLTTLLRPTAGTLRVNGFDPNTQQDEVRRSFGIVFQDPSIDDDLTAEENMQIHAILYGVPKHIRKTRIPELLRFVELEQRKDDLVKTFSGGMKRRLEIARGLIHHPRILFLDEPTLGLDPQTRNSMWEHITRLRKQEHMTVFFTTHYMEEVERVADRVAIIDHGKIISIGTSAQLKKATKKRSLEDAFLALTGHTIRDEQVNSTDRMRMARKVWGR
jgi:ABC-2 type transport system ATP-binding protein